MLCKAIYEQIKLKKSKIKPKIEPSCIKLKICTFSKAIQSQILPAAENPCIRICLFETTPHGGFVIGHELLGFERRETIANSFQHALVQFKLSARHHNVEDAHGLAVVIRQNIEHLKEIEIF